MVESLQTSAQLTTVVEVDVTRIAALRGRIKADFELREGVKLSFLPFFCKAAVEALKVYPQINSSIDMDRRHHHVSRLREPRHRRRTPTEGLLVPVVRDAGDLNIAGIARRIADLAERTRTNKVGPDEVSGGTFTVTNTGSRGALFDTPIINMPQVAILGYRLGRQNGRSSSVTTGKTSSRFDRWSTCRCPTTTASSMVPTPLDFSVP